MAFLKAIAIGENYGLGITETVLTKIRHCLLLGAARLDRLVPHKKQSIVDSYSSPVSILWCVFATMLRMP